MEIIEKHIETYAKNYTTEDSQLLEALIKEADQKLRHIDMLCGPVVGQLLAMLVAISGAKRVLEIGTFVGYSALQMAPALPDDGTLITCDTNERYAKIARSYFSQSEHGSKIDLRIGPALQTLKTLEGGFDFVFLDADKNNYPNYYRALLPLLNPGALLVIDNVLWDGEVLKPTDQKAEAIHQLNETIKEDTRVQQVMLTVRDGLMIVRQVGET